MLRNSNTQILAFLPPLAEAGLFQHKMVMLPVLVQMVIMLVNGNLGTSVAVLGAFSLVRFRSVPGTSKEMAVIFFAMEDSSFLPSADSFCWYIFGKCRRKSPYNPDAPQ